MQSIPDSSSLDTEAISTTRRKLRIAWSVVWIVITALLILLWVRSSQIHDVLQIKIRNSGPQYFEVHSIEGRLTSVFKVYQGFTENVSLNHSGVRPELRNIGYPDDFGNYPDSIHFRIFRWAHGLTEYQTPMWFPVFLSATLTIIPWVSQLRCRFSLRALLIATTLVAAVLGLIAWSIRG